MKTLSVCWHLRVLRIKRPKNLIVALCKMTATNPSKCLSQFHVSVMMEISTGSVPLGETSRVFAATGVLLPTDVCIPDI